ncbi:MAG: cation diffusion facilitator family transporter [Myxococcota bacterium]
MAWSGTARDRQVGRVLLIEGAANVATLVLKLIVGLSTGSMAVLGDAIHSLADVANNFVAWFVTRMSTRPPDRDHPYGHRKFETLAVFVLATLLTLLAFELVLGVLRREATPVDHRGWAFGMMLCVLAINIAISSWEGWWAGRLDSDILRADTRHTVADVLTTVVVIAGWQLAARGHAWMDTVCALGVAALIAYLAFDLFRRAIPVLVDHVAVDPETVTRVVAATPGVRGVLGVRSRWIGPSISIDLTISVDPALRTSQSHEICEAIEAAVARDLSIHDVTVHVEPETR